MNFIHSNMIHLNVKPRFFLCRRLIDSNDPKNNNVDVMHMRRAFRDLTANAKYHTYIHTYIHIAILEL